MQGKGQARPTSVAAPELPDELVEFLSRDTYSLLIKGDSGTGKTILALTILKALRPIENPLYLSTRTSPLQLMENYPWLEDIFGSPGPQGDGKEPETLETFVDARLDEPNVVFERITNVLMDKQAPTVVIDSWESLSDTLGTEALRTNIRVLQTWRERAGARFIFIGEDPQNSAIDFMVEGVVVLKERVNEGRRLREAFLSKLHGVQISKPSYFFTLQGGTFTSIPGYSPRDYAFRKPLPVTLDRPFRRVKGKYPTGYASLDSQLNGGYPAKAKVVLEIDRRVDPKVVLKILSRSIQDWLASGDRHVKNLRGHIERHFLNQFAKSFGSGSKGRLEIKRPNQKVPRNERRINKGRTMVIDDETAAGGVAGWTEQGVKPDLRIALRREEDRLPEGTSVHFRIMDFEGTLFVTSEIPWSGLHAVIPGMTAGNPMITLEPVV